MKKTKRICKLLLLVVGALLVVWRIAAGFNERVLPVYRAIAESEVRNATANVIAQTLRQLTYVQEDLLSIDRDDRGRITQITYNTNEINRLSALSVQMIQETLVKAAAGEEDPYSQLVYYHKGIIYQIPLGYFTDIALFSQLGPKLSVYMEYLNDASVEPRITSSPYGVNSTLVKIELQVTAGMSVVSPFVYDRIQVESCFPLVVQLVKGEAISINTVQP